MQDLMDRNAEYPRAAYVTPAPSRTSGAREPPMRTRCSTIDLAVGGVSSGSLTIVTTTDHDLRVAIGVNVASGFRDARPSRVLLATSACDGYALGGRIRALTDGNTIPDPSMAVQPSPPSRITEPEIVIAPDVRDAAAADQRLRALAAPVGLIVVIDADFGGRWTGGLALAEWRDLAARLAVPIVLSVSGTAAGWAEPRDAHVDLFRTLGGRDTRTFIARGVPPHSHASTRFVVTHRPSFGEIHASNRGTHLVRFGGMTWAPEPDFDGTLRARPTLMLPTELSVQLADPSWAPADGNQAQRTLEALAAAVATEDDACLAAVSNERLRSVISACAVAWGRPAEKMWRRAVNYVTDRSSPPYRAVRSRGLAPSTFAEPPAEPADSSDAEPTPPPRYDLEALRRAMTRNQRDAPRRRSFDQPMVSCKTRDIFGPAVRQMLLAPIETDTGAADDEPEDTYDDYEDDEIDETP